MSGGNGPRTVLYDSEGDNPLVGSTALSSSIPVVLANNHPVIGVSGTVSVIPVAGVTGSITGSVGLSGPVAISNFPATQSVTQGTSPWIISGSTWTPSVTGSVRVENTINANIGNFPATQVVSASNWVPSVLGLSGSVTGLLVGGQPLSAANPIPITGSISVTAPAVQNVTGSNWVPTVTGSVVVTNQVNVTGSNWTQSVVGLSGSVVGLMQGGLPVSMTNPVPITGTMAVQGVVAVSGSMDVTGSVKLSQAPQVLQGTSPWIVSGTSWVPQVTGSVVVANRVDVTGSNWIPTITGSVVVANTVNVTVLSGSVTGLLVGGQPISAANPLPISGSATPSSIVGTLGVLNATVQLNTVGLQSVGLQLAAGTLIGTIVPEVSFDDGTTWNPTYFSDPGTGALASSLIFGSANTAAGKIIVSVGGSGLTRVRVSAYTSGTASATVRASNIGKQVALYEGIPALPGPPTVAQVGGTDGTNLRVLSVDSSGRAVVTGSIFITNFPAAQSVTQGTTPWVVSGSAWTPTITGSVVVANQVNVTGSNWIPSITGSVRVTNIVDVTGSNWVPQVTGSVRVTNIVDVTGSNWIPQITGSVRVINRVDVTGSAWTPVVTGSVRVENVVNVTGSNWIQTSTIAGYMSASVYGISGTTQLNLAVDSQGRIVTAPAGATSTNAGFVFGKMDTTLQVLGVIEHTTYTEQTSNAQRSIVSTSGSDHWNSGSAQQVTITYYTVSGSGPKTEIINLSGTNSANTVNTDICFIEKMEVTRAGAYTTNSGTISLKAAVNGGGATIGSIGGSAGQTFWCHHYVPSGSTCYITGLLGGKNNNTAQGSGGTFHIKSTPLNVATPIKKQISDFLNAYGQANSVERTYGTPIAVVGPTKIDVWVYPDSALTTTYIASIDFYEQTS